MGSFLHKFLHTDAIGPRLKMDIIAQSGVIIDFNTSQCRASDSARSVVIPGDLNIPRR